VLSPELAEGLSAERLAREIRIVAALQQANIVLWKNADAELQPRVADARKRLTRLTPVEKSRNRSG